MFLEGTNSAKDVIESSIIRNVLVLTGFSNIALESSVNGESDISVSEVKDTIPVNGESERGISTVVISILRVEVGDTGTRINRSGSTISICDSISLIKSKGEVGNLEDCSSVELVLRSVAAELSTSAEFAHERNFNLSANEILASEAELPSDLISSTILSALDGLLKASEDVNIVKSDFILTGSAEKLSGIVGRASNFKGSTRNTLTSNSLKESNAVIILFLILVASSSDDLNSDEGLAKDSNLESELGRRIRVNSVQNLVREARNSDIEIDSNVSDVIRRVVGGHNDGVECSTLVSREEEFSIVSVTNLDESSNRIVGSEVSSQSSEVKKVQSLTVGDLLEVISRVVGWVAEVGSSALIEIVDFNSTAFEVVRNVLEGVVKSQNSDITESGVVSLTGSGLIIVENDVTINDGVNRVNVKLVPSERNLAGAISVLSVISASVTLNSVSEDSRTVVGSKKVDSTNNVAVGGIQGLGGSVIAESDRTEVVTNSHSLSSELTVEERSGLKAAENIRSVGDVIGGNDSEVALSAVKEELNLVDQEVLEEVSVVSEFIRPVVCSSSIIGISENSDDTTLVVKDGVGDEVVSGDSNSDGESVSGIDSKIAIVKVDERSNEVEGEGADPRKLRSEDESLLIGGAETESGSTISVVLCDVEEVLALEELDGLGVILLEVVVEDDLILEENGFIVISVSGRIRFVGGVDSSGVSTVLWLFLARRALVILAAWAFIFRNTLALEFSNLIVNLDSSLESGDGDVQEFIVDGEDSISLFLVLLTLVVNFSFVTFTSLLNLLSSGNKVLVEAFTSLEEAQGSAMVLGEA